MALSSTTITVTVTVKGYAAADAPMAGIDKAALSRIVAEWVRRSFPTRTPHLALNSNSENRFRDVNEIHAAVAATVDKEALPVGDLGSTQRDEPVTVSVSVA